MSEDYDVDVIILSWNRIEETIAAIDSALDQKGVRAAVHIVDQGSTTENLRALQDYLAGRPHVFLTSLKDNIGVPGGRNLAASGGHAPYIVALDNDAEFATTDTVRKVVEILSAEPELGAIGFRILNFFTGEDDHTSWGYSDREWERRDLEFAATNFVGAGHAIRRSAFEAVGGYDNRLFFAWEELELGLKLINLGYKIRYVGRVAVRHKVSPEARVKWDQGRFFFTVRNRIYISAKSGDSLGRILQTAGGFVVRGIRRGLVWHGLRGITAGLLMYHRLPACDRGISRLKPHVAAYVDTLNHRQDYSFWDRLRNAWRLQAKNSP